MDEHKLLALDDSDALSIFRRGELARIYAHLLSLGHLKQMIDAANPRTETMARLLSPRLKCLARWLSRSEVSFLPRDIEKYWFRLPLERLDDACCLAERLKDYLAWFSDWL